MGCFLALDVYVLRCISVITFYGKGMKKFKAKIANVIVIVIMMIIMMIMTMIIV